MSATDAASQPTTQPDPQPSRSGRLLTLIRKLIDYGTALVATVRQRVAADPIFAKTSFGTSDLAVIFARIARGLHLAQALEARVLRRAVWLDKEPRPRTARPAPKPRPTPSAPSGGGGGARKPAAKKKAPRKPAPKKAAKKKPAKKKAAKKAAKKKSAKRPAKKAAKKGKRRR